MKYSSYIISFKTAAVLLSAVTLTAALSASDRRRDSLSDPVYSLIERICPGGAQHFSIQVDTSSSESFFELSQCPDGRISIRADCSVNAATGLNWYLKYYAGIHLSWNCMRATSITVHSPTPWPSGTGPGGSRNWTGWSSTASTCVWRR